MRNIFYLILHIYIFTGTYLHLTAQYMEQPHQFYFNQVLHSYRGKDVSPSHEVSWQTAHTSNNVYQQIDGLVSQCTLQQKCSLTAYLSVRRMQHCNTRPSGGSSEKHLG